MKMTLAPTQVYSYTLIAIVRVTVDGQMENQTLLMWMGQKAITAFHILTFCIQLEISQSQTTNI